MKLLQEGQKVRGTYEVERFLGEGAFAEVYRVKHRFLGRQAMKVFKIIGMTIGETEQMLGEAILLSRMGHPNIVRVFDANTTETSRGVCGFFTMEYVAGGSLERFWRSHGSSFVPIPTAVELMKQVCLGLAIAHSEAPPIIHRDIKPQNILVGYDATGLRAWLSDFGLAKSVNPLTLMASARGTPCFKAPEVFQDLQRDSCAGDVWALGSTLYLLLADRLPFGEACDLDSFDDKMFERPLIPPSRLNPRVDPLLDKIVLKALEVDPLRRYRDARALLHDLTRWKPRQANGELQGAGLSSEASKTALGPHSQADEKKARSMVDEAIRISQLAGSLTEAADLMEEAFNKWPALRDRYGDRLRLWRRGLVM